MASSSKQCLQAGIARWQRTFGRALLCLGLFAVLFTPIGLEYQDAFVTPSRGSVESAVSRRQLLAGAIPWAALTAGFAENAGADGPGSKVQDIGQSGGSLQGNILSLVNVFGRLAGADCSGSTVADLRSCEIRMEDFDRVIFNDGAKSLTQDQFVDKLRDASFRGWPVKPQRFGKDTTAWTSVNAAQPIMRTALFERKVPWSLPGPETVNNQRRLAAITTSFKEEPLPELGAELVFERLVDQSGGGGGGDIDVTIDRAGVESFVKRMGGAIDFNNFLYDFLGRAYLAFPAGGR